jgi:DNA-binding transcriptional MerR regulator
MALFSTSQLCREAGVSRGQLRLYEREGLIAPPSRTAAGYRRYTAEIVLRLKAIQGLKEVGLTLAEIGTLLTERDFDGLSRGDLQKKAAYMLLKAEEHIRRLQVIRQYLAGFARGDFEILSDPDCQFLTSFLSAGPLSK